MSPCPNCRLARVRYFHTNLLQGKFMLLRYVDKIKSAPLNHVHWHQAVQLGWFCNCPIVPDTDETFNVHHATVFQMSLSAFLQSLGVDVKTLLHRVDFSQLSPAVTLIYTVPSTCSYSE